MRIREMIFANLTQDRSESLLNALTRALRRVNAAGRVAGRYGPSMEHSRPPATWVVFDLGEVLSQSPPHLPRLAALIGADVRAFEEAYWSNRDTYDAGGSAELYWAHVAADVNRAMNPELIRALSDEDVSAWVTLHPESVPLLEELTSRRIRLGLLSNAPATLAAAVRSQPWALLFDQLVFSADIGISKPDRRAFDLTAAKMGAAASDIIFFDDRQPNVTGAEGAGWNAFRWEGHADARRVLTRLGVF